jgi:hypothetical protein
MTEKPLLILASPTEWEVEADGVRCRLWQGVIEGAGECVLLVHRVLTEDAATTAFLSATLINKPYPRAL